MNIFSKITEYFLNNKAITSVLLIFIVVAGIGSFLLTPKQYNPEVKIPAFQIVVDYPGASSSDVDKLITRELQEKISDIQGIDNIVSYSYGGGRSVVNVFFNVGEDIEESEVKVRTKVSSFNSEVKHLNLDTSIQTINPEDVPILTIGFKSHNYNQNELREKISLIKNELRKVNSVSNLSIHGGESKAIKVELDLGKLKYYGVSPFEIEEKIRNNNLTAQHFERRTGFDYSQIELDGSLKEVEDIQNLQIRSYLKLKDLAKIKEGYSQKKSYVYLENKDNQNDLVFLSIAKVEGSNTSTVTKDILKKLDEVLSLEIYKDINYQVLNNDGEVANNEISGLGINLLQSIGIVMVILLFFLDKRSAILVAISIPLTLLLVFILGYFTGNTINRITMFSLILSLGLLVDSATVVVENIYRHLSITDNKKSKFNTIVKAVSEVGSGLFMSTLTSVVVFLPTSQISGMMGEYMGPLSFFVPVALLMSLIVSLVFIPFLSEKFLKVETNQKPNRVIEFLTNFYKSSLKTLINSRKYQKGFLLTILTALFISFSFVYFELVHFKMLPTANRDQFFIYVDLKEGSDIIQTKEKVSELNQILLKNENIEDLEVFIGEPAVTDFNGLFKGSNFRYGSNQATIKVNLTNSNTRSIKSEQIVEKIREDLNTNFDSNNLTYRILEDPPGPPVASTVLAKIKSNNEKDRLNIANQITKMFSTTQGTVHTDNSNEEGIYREKLIVDFQKLGFYDVEVNQIYSILKGTFTNNKVSEIKNNNSQEISFIEISVPYNDSKKVDILNDLFVTNKRGQVIPLRNIVRLESTRQQSTYIHDNKELTSYVFAETNKRSVVYIVIEIIGEILNNKIEGYSIQNWNLYQVELKNNETNEMVKIEWGGEWEMTLDNFRDLGIAMIVAFLLVFATLTAQFQSAKIALIIMSTIPLGFIGIIPGFAILDGLNNTYLTATSLIGFIALMGIVVNNAIIYFEYFEQLKKQGKSTFESLIESGTTRFRPILLTTLTTVLGSLTIANDPVWSGLAWSIVFGLSVSTVLTLFLFPTIIVLTEKPVAEK